MKYSYNSEGAGIWSFLDGLDLDGLAEAEAPFRGRSSSWWPQQTGVAASTHFLCEGLRE